MSEKLQMKSINKSKVFFGASIFVFILSMMVQMYVANVFAVKGAEMADLKNQADQTRKLISELTLEKSELSTLTTIQSQATAQGFIEMTTAVNTLHPVSVASLNSVTY